MAKENTLDIQLRESTGKSASKKVLASGRIPSVVYGHICLLYTSPSPRD